MEMQRPQKPDPSTGAPSPPKDEKVRPEDVTFEEMPEDIGGIIITGARKPKEKPDGGT